MRYTVAGERLTASRFPSVTRSGNKDLCNPALRAPDTDCPPELPAFTVESMLRLERHNRITVTGIRWAPIHQEGCHVLLWYRLESRPS